VPPGFVVTTAAFRHAASPLPDGIRSAIAAALARHGEERSYAVRSSATAEDRPGASFAGQHDTELNVRGLAAIERAVQRCWASLHSERAAAYRDRHRIGHGDVAMAVVVQQMVPADAAGVVFTADPLTAHRRVAVVEAVAGLGDALVSGRADPDVYELRDGHVTTRAIAADRRLLNDSEVISIEAAARRIEAHFGCPQDVEWCLAGGVLHIVQTRPITTAFPIPEHDGGFHVYISVGHQQMMTDPLTPLGISVWQMTAARQMFTAGGRLFVDVAGALASPPARDALIAMIERSDPLIGGALRTVAARLQAEPVEAGPLPPSPPLIDADPSLVAALIAENEASVAALEQRLATRDGVAALDAIAEDTAEMKRILFEPRSTQVIMTGMQATWWLNDHLSEWLGAVNAADVLSHSAPGNVTSEMGLALLDVADAVRPHPDVVDFLRQVDDDDFLDELADVRGGHAARDAITGFLDRYGMRCIGEIDITRPRWSERPSALIPLILANVENFPAGERARSFAAGLRRAEESERDVLQRLRALPGGEAKATETKAMIDRLRTFIGYREYPKYGLIRRYSAYKRAIMRVAAQLAADSVIAAPEDAFFLTFDELRDAAHVGHVDADLIRVRREAFRTYAALTPPRVMTSDGEIVIGSYDRTGAPEGALVGLAVSAGTVEGRARVVLDVAQADLRRGDILVTTATDPSWSPVFVSAAALVTEVGGLMTHGAVIAREYGLPAVVGVEHATTLIRDGRRIRVHGGEGFVELLDDE
jgi:pyruvate,water dikinase